jgi:transglutaminase-like putative cysteine protease
MPTYSVRHVTSYRYGDAVTVGHHLAHLLPRATERQDVHAAAIELVPPAHHRGDFVDAFGNRATYLLVPGPAVGLEVTATCEVSVASWPPWPDDNTAPRPARAWDEVATALATDYSPAALEARRFALWSPFVGPSADLAAYAAGSFPPGRPLDEAAVDLMSRIHADFTFDPSFSDVSTPVAEVLAARRGVCQDFAHLMIGALRSLGLAARYVSGYIETEPPPGQPRLVGADASHAWCSVWIPDRGWLDCDPTNDQAPPQRHITVAWGREYGDVTPLRGVVYGPAADQELSVAVDVVRVG